MLSDVNIWLNELSEGSNEAFSRLFEEYYSPLVVFADTYLDDMDEAKDIVQDVFLTLINKRQVFSTISKLKAYMYTLVKNKCLNQIRSSKVKAKYIEYELHSSTNEESFWNKVLEEEVYYHLYKAIDKLSPKAKEVYMLSLEGKKNKEIAEELNVAIETVKSHKKQNKGILKKYLEALNPTPVILAT